MHRLASILALACVASVVFAADALAADASETHVALPSVGLTFDAPSGWTRRPEKSERELARFAHIVGGKLVGSVIVEIAGHRADKLKAIADQVVASEKGQVIVASPPLPGEAIELRLPAQPDVPLAADLVAISAAKDDALVITSVASDEATATATLRSILASVVTADPKPAGDCLETPGVPFALFDSQVMLTLPAPFRLVEKPKNSTEAMYGVHDRVSGHDDCMFTIKQQPNPKGLPIEEIARASAAALTAKFQLKTPMTATRVNNAPAAMVSSSFEETGGKPSTQRIVWLRLDGQHYALLIFNVIAADPAVHDRYVALAESVAKGLKIGKAFASTRPSVAASPKS